MHQGDRPDTPTCALRISDEPRTRLALWQARRGAAPVAPLTGQHAYCGLSGVLCGTVELESAAGQAMRKHQSGLSLLLAASANPLPREEIIACLGTALQRNLGYLSGGSSVGTQPPLVE